MFRIYYETKIRNFYKQLYKPSNLHKVYNYISCKDIDLSSIAVGQTFNIGNLQQHVLEKDDEGFFIAPGLYMENALAKQDFRINISGIDYDMSFNPFSSLNTILIGSLVFTDTYNHLNVGDSARVVDMHDNIVYLKNIKINNIQHIKDVYLHDTTTTVVKFNKSLDMLDWLNKTTDMSIYSLDTPLKDLDMNIAIRCFGGYPTIDLKVTNLPQYKIELTDLDTEETTVKNIYQFHNEKINAKHRYSLLVKDQLNNVPVLVNDSVAETGGPIYLDFSTMDKFTMMTQTDSSSRTKFSELAEPLFHGKVR